MNLHLNGKGQHHAHGTEQIKQINIIIAIEICVAPIYKVLESACWHAPHRQCRCVFPHNENKKPNNRRSPIKCFHMQKSILSVRHTLGRLRYHLINTGANDNFITASWVFHFYSMNRYESTCNENIFLFCRRIEGVLAEWRGSCIRTCEQWIPFNCIEWKPRI